MPVAVRTLVKTTLRSLLKTQGYPVWRALFQAATQIEVSIVFYSHARTVRLGQSISHKGIRSECRGGRLPLGPLKAPAGTFYMA